MRKFAPRIIAFVALLVIALVLAAMTGLIPRGPMHHGWDWPWHDWWHSQTGSTAVEHHGSMILPG